MIRMQVKIARKSIVIAGFASALSWRDLREHAINIVL